MPRPVEELSTGTVWCLLFHLLLELSARYHHNEPEDEEHGSAVLKAHHSHAVRWWREWQLVRWNSGHLALSPCYLTRTLRVMNLAGNLTLSGIPHYMTPLTDLMVKWWSKRFPLQDRGAHGVREVSHHGRKRLVLVCAWWTEIAIVANCVVMPVSSPVVSFFLLVG